LAASHGPFTWGPDADEAVDNAIALEMIAAMALYTSLLEPSVPSLDSALLDRHFLRKHGREAYYGQTID
jgi:L-ribulose-5-phosphate 4-epimerase